MRIADFWPFVIIGFLTYCYFLNENAEPKHRSSYFLFWNPKNDNEDTIFEKKLKAGLWWVGVYILIAFVEGLVTTKESHQVVNIIFGIYIFCAVVAFLEYIYKRWFKKSER